MGELVGELVDECGELVGDCRELIGEWGELIGECRETVELYVTAPYRADVFSHDLLH